MTIPPKLTKMLYYALLGNDWIPLSAVCKTSPKTRKIARKYFDGELKRRCKMYAGPDKFQREMSKYWNRRRR